MNSIKSGLAFVASHLQVKGELPIEVLPGYQFRAASDAEVAVIRQHLESSIPSDRFGWVQYDGIVKEQRQENGSSFHTEKLPRENWKYWVLAFEDYNLKILDIEMLAQLLPVKFDIGFVLGYSEQSQQGTIISHQAMPIHVIDRYSLPTQIYANAEVLTSDQIASIGNAYQSLKNLLPEYKFIDRALRNLYDLRRIPEYSDLIIVGLFSIVESLITHHQRESETFKSIQHQITNKMILLRKKYFRPIPTDQYFSECNEETIWKKLYDFRSAVAHGSNAISFDNNKGDNKYQVLKSRDAVIAFVQNNVKELLQVALNEPTFMLDLRKC